MKKRIVLFIFTILMASLTGCGDTYTNHLANNDESIKWVPVATLSGTADQQQSQPFQLNGGEIKISSRIRAKESGGNGLVYILEEGSTVAHDTDGNIRVASFDQSIISVFDMDVEREVIANKEAGSWYIHFNSSSLENWEVTVYESAQSQHLTQIR
ncbi:MAG: hypothetical protein FWE90_13620 [Defluviitaleaceae bacterium]|nr:hypothetical protein [Defluviitaleaceae bacterium]